jgi:hypothetical protein
MVPSRTFRLSLNFHRHKSTMTPNNGAPSPGGKWGPKSRALRSAAAKGGGQHRKLFYLFVTVLWATHVFLCRMELFVCLFVVWCLFVVCSFVVCFLFALWLVSGGASLRVP